MREFLWVGLGGAFGSMVRHGVTVWAGRNWGERLGETLPWGTMLVNGTGCLLIGLLLGWQDASGRPWLGETGRLGWVVGFCGGYTTFSAFSFQTLRLLQNREWGWAAAHVAVSVLVCLAAVALGYFVATLISGRR